MISKSGAESKEHYFMKRILRRTLKKDLFRDNEIHFEYPVILPSGKVRIIDLVAISPEMGKKFAYEVGDLNGGSIDELYCLFDKVKNVPKIGNTFDHVKEFCEFMLDELNRKDEEIDELKNEMNRLNYGVPWGISQKTSAMDNFYHDQFLEGFRYVFGGSKEYYKSEEKEKKRLVRKHKEEKIIDEINFLYEDRHLGEKKFNKVFNKLCCYYNLHNKKKENNEIKISKNNPFVD